MAEDKDIEYTIKTFKRFSLDYTNGSDCFWRVTYPGSPGFLTILWLSDGLWNITVYTGSVESYENKYDYNTPSLELSIINDFLRFSNKNQHSSFVQETLKTIPDKFKLAWMFGKIRAENVSKLNLVGLFD